MITDEMKREVADFIKTMIDRGKIGLGGNSTTPTSTDLDVPLSSVTPTIVTSKSTDNVIEAKLSISGNSIQGKVIREAGLFEASGEGGNMVQRVNFNGVGPFSTDETLEIFILMEVE